MSGSVVSRHFGNASRKSASGQKAKSQGRLDMKRGRQQRRPYFSSSLTITVRFSSWCAKAIQLREMPESTADRRDESCGSFARILYSAAYILHCWIVTTAIAPDLAGAQNSQSPITAKTGAVMEKAYKQCWGTGHYKIRSLRKFIGH